MVGQRLVLNLRGFQTRHYTTRDVSREVDRQMAAMGGTSFWGGVEQPNGVHYGRPRGPERSRSSRATQMADVELKDVLPGDAGARFPMTEEICEVLRADEESQTTTSRCIVRVKKPMYILDVGMGTSGVNDVHGTVESVEARPLKTVRRDACLVLVD
ncbi:hypothetical protein BU15DRAFT_67115 [Melanogaster broomeanus]|nr:hypothetical protein BU15DRAFT_67115 [Melanogaster broomeanus]